MFDSNSFVFSMIRNRQFTLKKYPLQKDCYDFYLPDRNIVIEYDGPQHFQQVEYFQKTRQDFLKAQERDRRKNNYALAHGIPLYRIPYWEINELCGLSQIFDEKHLVKTMYHNDRLSKPKKL